MDLPPSGWYPDPYRVPGLLRWWDGSTWTQHTHSTGGTDGTEGTGQAATAQQPAVPQSAVPQTTVQPAVVPPTSVQPTVQAGAQPGAQAGSVQPTSVQPAVQAGAQAGAGGVQPTSVQPAVQPGVAPTVYQPAVTSAQPAAVQPGVRPTAVQPTTVQPATVHPGGPPQGADDNGTQVLFLGDDAWTAPGMPAGPAQGSRFGYYQAQRRRRMWVMGGLAGGTAVALGLIALVVSTLSSSPAAPAAAQTSAATPAAEHTTPPASATPSPTPSATPPGSLLADGQSGLSYTQLGSPWQPSCPAGLNNGTFTWTAGESAIAGQVNGGQTPWYGAACSGPLPQQYGYNGVADLENTATNLVNTFNGAYYGPLQHNFQQEVSQPLQVSGHAGWEVKFLMTYTAAQAQGLTWNDEMGAVVVADLGAGMAPAVFYVSIPGNLGENNVDSLVSSLQLSVPQQPAGSPPAGSPDAGSPAPGNGNGNGN